MLHSKIYEFYKKNKLIINKNVTFFVKILSCHLRQGGISYVK